MKNKRVKQVEKLCELNAFEGCSLLSKHEKFWIDEGNRKIADVNRCIGVLIEDLNLFEGRSVMSPTRFIEYIIKPIDYKTLKKDAKSIYSLIPHKARNIERVKEILEKNNIDCNLNEHEHRNSYWDEPSKVKALNIQTKKSNLNLKYHNERNLNKGILQNQLNKIIKNA